MSALLAGFLAQDQAHHAEARDLYARYLALEPAGAYSSEVASVLEQLPRD
jgi:hypothetical protein